MNCPEHLPPLLYRLWSDLMRDTADWLQRSPNLLTQLAGMVCLRRALQKTLELDDLLHGLGIDASTTPALGEDKARILEEMADARTPEVFFSAIPLFWVPVMQSAIEDHGEAAIDSEEAERIVAILCRDEVSRAECFRWAGHLVDVFSEAGGFDVRPLSAGNTTAQEDYRWNGDVPQLDSKYLEWSDRKEQGQPVECENRILAGFLAILVLYDSWCAIEKTEHRRVISENLLLSLDAGIDALEELYSGDLSQLPLKLSRDKYVESARLSLNARLELLGVNQKSSETHS